MPPKTSSIRLVVETRPRTYPPRKDIYPYWEKGKLKFRDDPGGQGWEVVQEIVVCPACAEENRHL